MPQPNDPSRQLLARPYRTWAEQPPEQVEWITDVARLAAHDFVISSACGSPAGVAAGVDFRQAMTQMSRDAREQQSCCSFVENLPGQGFHHRRAGLTNIGAAAKNPWVSDSRTGCVGKGPWYRARQHAVVEQMNDRCCARPHS
jgi:hypothetical protein